jgi:hypothetical protein
VCLLTLDPALALQRKNTLLVEYRQLRKSNAFIDRRFGGALQPLLAAKVPGKLASTAPNLPLVAHAGPQRTMRA